MLQSNQIFSSRAAYHKLRIDIAQESNFLPNVAGYASQLQAAEINDFHGMACILEVELSLIYFSSA